MSTLPVIRPTIAGAIQSITKGIATLEKVIANADRDAGAAQERENKAAHERAQAIADKDRARRIMAKLQDLVA